MQCEFHFRLAAGRQDQCIALFSASARRTLEICRSVPAIAFQFSCVVALNFGITNAETHGAGLGIRQSGYNYHTWELVSMSIPSIFQKIIHLAAEGMRDGCERIYFRLILTTDDPIDRVRGQAGQANQLDRQQ